MSHLVRAFTAETDWAPIVLLGSHLGIRSKKPISHHTHFPPSFGDLIPASMYVWMRGESCFHWCMDKPQDPFHFLCLLSISSYREPLELTNSITCFPSPSPSPSPNLLLNPSSLLPLPMTHDSYYGKGQRRANWLPAQKLVHQVWEIVNHVLNQHMVLMFWHLVQTGPRYFALL